ncbi:putative phage tail protein [Leptotrichia shahii]|uniref:putative phage tail protein n=1 Tax=Leptotrichia shahii TaxID=157691 RepID=UPI0028D02857|nr:putative phage tail protein [Leptotrichia shahii]
MIFFEMKNVDLLKYLPFFMQEYKEIQKIMESEEPEFKIMWDRIKKVFNNEFIEFCNDEGIKKFENMLGIFPESTDSLELRIFRVLTYWNSKIPFTWKVLINKMNQLCGNPSEYGLTLDNNNYMLNIITKFDSEKKYDELNRMLKSIIPANLGVKSVNIVKQKTILNLKVPIATLLNHKYEIKAMPKKQIKKLIFTNAVVTNYKYKI